MGTLLRVLNIRPGEIAITFVLFLVYFLVLCTHYFLKPTRDALFLAGSGPAALPLVFMLSAVVSAPLTTLMTKQGRGIPIHRLLVMTFLILALFLVGLRALIQVDASWVDYAFYIWVGIFGAVTTSQFWLLANAVFDSTQAKRLFAILGTGGILGAIAGGELTRFFVSEGMPPEDLLWVSAGVLLAASVLAALAWRLAPKTAAPRVSGRRRTTENEPSGSLRAFQQHLRSRPHLALTMAILAATVSVGTLVDFQFKTVAYGTFSDPSELTGFFGTFYARVSALALVVQIFLSGRLLSSLGTSGSLLVLPVTLVVGTVLMLVSPGLSAAIVLRGGEMTWKYSVDKTARELLFLPLPTALKREAKVIADLFVDRWFRGIAGGLLLILTTGLGFGARGVAVASAVLLATWIILVLRMRPAYTEAFRSMLASGGGHVDVGETRVTDPALLVSFAESMATAEPGTALHMLALAGDAPSPELDARLPDLLSSRSAALRRAAVEAMVTRGVRAPGGEVNVLLIDPEPAVRREAARYMWQEGGKSWLAEALATDDEPLIAAVLDALATHGADADLEAVTPELLERLISRKCGATLRHAIMRFAARRRDPEVSEWILVRLGSRTDRAQARASLAAYGPGILDLLTERIGDPGTKPAHRRALVYVIGEIPDDAAVGALMDELAAGDRELHPHLIRALHRLRRRFAHLDFPAPAVRHALEDEVSAWFAAAQAHHTLASIDVSAPSGRLLLRALAERRDQAVRRVFRLLALIYDPEAMAQAYANVISADRVARANAREYVEQTLDAPERMYVLPMLDTEADVFESGRQLFGLALTEHAETLRYFVTGPDVWLASCAIWASGGVDDHTLGALVRDAQSGRYPLIRETARLALGRRSA
jgi:ATP/ADP translocase